MSSREKVITYMLAHPDAKVREAASATGVSAKYAYNIVGELRRAGKLDSRKPRWAEQADDPVIEELAQRDAADADAARLPQFDALPSKGNLKGTWDVEMGLTVASLRSLRDKHIVEAQRCEAALIALGQPAEAS